MILPLHLELPVTSLIKTLKSQDRVCPILSLSGPECSDVMNRIVRLSWGTHWLNVCGDRAELVIETRYRNATHEPKQVVPLAMTRHQAAPYWVDEAIRLAPKLPKPSGPSLLDRAIAILDSIGETPDSVLPAPPPVLRLCVGEVVSVHEMPIGTRFRAGGRTLPVYFFVKERKPDTLETLCAREDNGTVHRVPYEQNDRYFITSLPDNHKEKA